MTKVSITVDDGDVTRELERLSRGLDLGSTLKLEGAVLGIVAEVAAIIHVETGSLKSTVRPADGGFDETDVSWRGGVVVGGAAPGEVRDPAYYGVYELARGGSHFFLEPAYVDLPSVVKDAIEDFMAGGIKGDLPVSTGNAGSFSRTVKSESKSAEARAHSGAKKIGKTSERAMSSEELANRSKTAGRIAKKPSKSSSAFYLG